MKKAEIIKLLRERISEKYPQPVVKNAIPYLVDEIFSILKEEISKGEELRIVGFGVFKHREVKREGDAVSKKVIRFIPSKK